jgi:arylformamidase
MEPTMTWIDISVPLQEDMIIWPGDPPYRRELIRSMAAGATCNVSHLDFGAHSGTHVDAPGHFIDGAAGVETTPLQVLIGPAWVVDATGVSGPLDRQALDALDMPAGETRLLFRTANGSIRSRGIFDREFVALDADGAAAIVDRGTRLVGIDFLSVARFDDPVETHQTLLGTGVVVLEGLDLRHVEPGPYELVCLPLRAVGSDGGPARALLRPRPA